MIELKMALSAGMPASTDGHGPFLEVNNVVARVRRDVV
jgi:hypothetical protein